ncbi:hypothetical protein [Acetobacterium sp. UBA5834]|uniref:hypothetical protein n=1 Tax=Acetobacterium sp. UBA5834 TaxID=1945907 RepID=UPI00257FF923|nr:hypothetical protein [Acetobacterium sp. UBA5834]
MRNLKKYGFVFEDKEYGADVPVIIDVYAANWEEACIKGQDLCLMADRAKDEGERVYKEIKHYRQRRGL